MKPIFSLLAVASLAAAPAPKSSPWITGWEQPKNPTGRARIQREGESLTIMVPGKGHEFDVRQNRLNAPHLLREVEGDFVCQVRVRVTSNPTAKEGYHRAGLMFHDGEYAVKVQVGVYLDAEKPLWRCFQSSERFGKGGGLIMRGLGSPLEQLGYLRFEREGAEIIAKFSPDGKKWIRTLQEDGRFIVMPKALKVGVLVESTGEGEFKAVFDQFELTRPKK